MKKVILLLITLSFGLSLQAQSIRGVDISKKKYVQVISFQRAVTWKFHVYIDYGQNDPEHNATGGQASVTDKEGKRKELISFIDTLNFFAELGWEVINIQTIQDGNYYRQFAQLKNKKVK